jgi:hypothetical protein
VGGNPIGRNRQSFVFDFATKNIFMIFLLFLLFFRVEFNCFLFHFASPIIERSKFNDENTLSSFRHFLHFRTNFYL